MIGYLPLSLTTPTKQERQATAKDATGDTAGDADPPARSHPVQFRRDRLHLALFLCPFNSISGEDGSVQKVHQNRSW